MFGNIYGGDKVYGKKRKVEGFHLLSILLMLFVLSLPDVCSAEESLMYTDLECDGFDIGGMKPFMISAANGNVISTDIGKCVSVALVM